MTTDELLALLDHVCPSAGGWSARCPAHRDREASLSVAVGDGKLLMHCFAGCTIESICAAIGIKTSDLVLNNQQGPPQRTSRPQAKTNPKSNGSVCSRPFEGTEADVEHMQCNLVKSREVQAYIESRGISLSVAADLKWGAAIRKVRDEQDQWVEKTALAVPHYCLGKLLGIKFKTIDGTKCFSQVAGSSTDGLYAIGHLDPNVAEVLILEGPEDAALAISHGFNAVAINSADAKVLPADIAALCRFQRNFVLGDQDVAGQRAMDAVLHRLPPEQVIRVRLPGFKDIGDLYAENPMKFPDRLRRLLRIARASREYFEPEDLLTEDDIHIGLHGIEPCVVDKLVPRNAITMVFGEEKGGKSALSFYIGKCTANGRPVFGKYATVKCPVLYLDLENSDTDIVNFATLFTRIGPEPIRYRTRATGCPDLNSPGLLRFCERFKPLVIFDSLTKFLRGTDPFHPAEMSELFDKLLDLCAVGATVILIHHATRDEALRYANSHQIGASVARAFAVVSEDRPRLHRVRLEGILFRGAEPISERLIGFPVIAERGEIGLAVNASDADPGVERVMAFVKSKGRAKREQIKTGAGMKHQHAVGAVARAIEARLLVEDSAHFLAVPERGNGIFEDSRSQDSGTAGTD